MALHLHVLHPSTASPILGTLREHGLEIGEAPLGALSFKPTRVYLVAVAAPLATIADVLVQTRARIGVAATLVACLDILAAPERRALLECGASAFITPRGTSTELVAERILADAIQAGALTPEGLAGMRGATPPMRAVYEHIDRVARFDEPVLVLGETGTGKDLAAAAVHQQSGRKGPFVAVNCAELGGSVLESELFGHERGAYTGAATKRVGLLLSAGDGTLFLDEVGELPLEAQAKLLRVLEAKKVRPLGSERWRDLRARVVLGTNRDLRRAADAGTFRADLYYRVSSLSFTLPPLRDRRADIPLLARGFLEEFDAAYPGRRRFPEGSMDWLIRRPWPGNVRELRNTIRRAAILADPDTGTLSVSDLLESSDLRPPAPPETSIPFDPLTDSWKDVEVRARTAYLRALLKACGSDRALAMEKSGLKRSTLYSYLSALNLQEEP